ncbi:MAG: hypothetical protein Q9160_002863 [Pyrenula sp. 1 TL-2023]
MNEMANNSSPPSLPSSFDPAIHLQLSSDAPPILPPSSFHSDDLEALHAQDIDLAAAKNRERVVIQHKSWTLAKGLLSDEVFNAETPSKTFKFTKSCGQLLSSSPSQPTMAFSSSPILYPPSSSPPAPPLTKKRKLFQTTRDNQVKKPKIVGGFLEEEDEATDTAPVSTIIHQKPADARKDEEQKPEPLLPSLDSLNSSQARKFRLPPIPRQESAKRGIDAPAMRKCSGETLEIRNRNHSSALSYERTIAARSSHIEGKAKTSYYGIEIHKLLDQSENLSDPSHKQSSAENAIQSVETLQGPEMQTPDKKVLWTEKYRATKFIDLVGDERSHRSMLRWFKSWDYLVFPGHASHSVKKKSFGENAEERQHRKILMLTGPPGLGKTTLAHVCARQAGYEVLEINASDDRSRDVVKGRIKDALGTENVRGIDIKGKGGKTTRVAGRPVCVIVDEVDGVVSGASGGGDGGFMKALIDLVQSDQKGSNNDQGAQRRRPRKDVFHQMRPLVLICNDVYHPSLRPLRASHLAEIVHLRKPPMDKVIARLKSIFEKEGVVCDGDAVRRLCEATWGIGSRKERSKAIGGEEGDIRSALVTGEWVAQKFRFSTNGSSGRLTRKWLEQNILSNGAQFESHLKGLGRGGVREVVERVFLEGAGLPNLPSAPTQPTLPSEATRQTSLGISDLRKRQAIDRLRAMIDTCGEHDRCMTDCFATYPTQTFQDDTFLSKPNTGYDWLHFHDQLSSKIFSSQEWELNPYLSQSVLAFHHLFATLGKHTIESERDNAEKDEDTEPHPFSGPRADFAAFEAEKQNRMANAEFQTSFSAPLLRLFRSVDTISSELLPYICRILSPDVKPIVLGGSGTSVASVRKESERKLVQHAVRVMSGLGVKFEKAKVELHNGNHGGFIFRMEPALDMLSNFQLRKENQPLGQPTAPVRYAVRQVLEQELHKEQIRQRSDARLARSSKFGGVDAIPQDVPEEDKENAESQGKKVGTSVKKDFFGRMLVNEARPASSKGNLKQNLSLNKTDDKRVWVSFHEGYSNAVRKPITLKELLESM